VASETGCCLNQRRAKHGRVAALGLCDVPPGGHPGHCGGGVRGKRLEHRPTAGDRPVRPTPHAQGTVREYHRTRVIRWEAGPPTVQGKLLGLTDSAQYREGTVKSTPVRGVKESLKPTASMQ
jgi:hypothetical protein